jgi:hypothetical protein
MDCGRGMRMMVGAWEHVQGLLGNMCRGLLGVNTCVRTPMCVCVCVCERVCVCV